MKVEYINPFIESVHEMLTTMFACEGVKGKIGVVKKGAGDAKSDVTALIGLSGPARGVVALVFSADTAMTMGSRMLGTELLEVDDTVLDAVAELVNIVGGGAKAKFKGGESDTPINLSLPTVVTGDNYAVDYPSQSMWLEVPFMSDVGSFRLRVTIEINQ